MLRECPLQIPQQVYEGETHTHIYTINVASFPTKQRASTSLFFKSRKRNTYEECEEYESALAGAVGVAIFSSIERGARFYVVMPAIEIVLVVDSMW